MFALFATLFKMSSGVLHRLPRLLFCAKENQEKRSKKQEIRNKRIVALVRYKSIVLTIIDLPTKSKKLIINDELIIIYH